MVRMAVGSILHCRSIVLKIIIIYILCTLILTWLFLKYNLFLLQDWKRGVEGGALWSIGPATKRIGPPTRL